MAQRTGLRSHLWFLLLGQLEGSSQHRDPGVVRMRNRVRLMVTYAFYLCQPAPPFQVLPWHRAITNGTLGGESQGVSCPSFSSGSGLQEQTNGIVQARV